QPQQILVPQVMNATAGQRIGRGDFLSASVQNKDAQIVAGGQIFRKGLKIRIINVAYNGFRRTLNVHGLNGLVKPFQKHHLK
ncbi:MAG: hypothetical protein EGR16_07455, partial [Clostridiales bacterium]|nr:hypothetical protein [Clostridiales bacterium]